MSVLDKMTDNRDLKKLDKASLKTLSEEIRKEIFKVTKQNGGHLASNLGAVELSVAIHYVFDLPKDKLLFDVGHQCYAHKILSGRKQNFDKIRTEDGPSGFPNSNESEFDPFTVGHAGTCLSASIGIAKARDLTSQDYSVIGIVGDGAITNGLNLEALTATENKPKNLLIILNDNGMSISKNANGFYKIISRGTTKPSYLKSKRAFKKIFKESFVTRFFRSLKKWIKHLFNKNDYFENFGFKYVGVIDGNDVNEMVKVLTRVKEVIKYTPVLLHVKTTKGKGYFEAENNADAYHGVSKDFCSKQSLFSDALGETVNELIKNDNSIVAITAAMKDGTGLKTVEENYPNNFIDVGICEEYAVTLAGGIAVGGGKPIVAVYSTFMQRAYDQILHDVCMQNLPVIFCIDRAGFVGADGKTHQGLFDLSFLSHMPNITIFAPSTVEEFKQILMHATKMNSPVAIRYPCVQECLTREYYPLAEGLWEKVRDGENYAVLAVGPRMVELGLQLFDKLDGVSVYSARTIKPLDEKVLESIKDKTIITLEENALIGGFGDSVKRYYAKLNQTVKIYSYGAEDKFTNHGKIDTQLKLNGLSVESVLNDLI